MARRRRNRRYRRSRLTVPFRILSFFLICGAILAALLLFFKVQTVTVAGNSRYTQEEILAVTDIQEGENLFLINKYAVASAITGQLPYVEAVQIRRSLPDGIGGAAGNFRARFGCDGKARLERDGAGSVRSVPQRRRRQA